MLYFKRSVVFVLAVYFLFNCGIVSAQKAPAGPKWYTNYEEALKAAEKSDKPILMLFTGSDWCKYCVMLQEEVFKTKDFQSWAKQNIILLELDFPRKKKQSQELADQNSRLQAQFKTSGFPMIVILDSQGREIGRTGYAAGKGMEWLEFIKEGIDRYYQYRMVEPKTSFTEALSQAKIADKILLVLQNDQNSGKMIGELLTNQDFVALAGSGMEVVMHGQMSEIDDTTAYDKFAKRFNLSQAKIVMIDPAEDNILYKSDELLPTSSLVKKLVKAFPQIPYNGQWIEDYDKAVTIASQQGRALLLNFTGSDWCKWCIKMEKEVMDQEEFKKYANENLVLVQLDFPRKREISKEIKRQNRRLEKKYDRKGFPNVVITDAAGKELGRIKYREQGIEGFINEVKGFIQATEAQGDN